MRLLCSVRLPGTVVTNVVNVYAIYIFAVTVVFGYAEYAGVLFFLVRWIAALISVAWQIKCAGTYVKLVLSNIHPVLAPIIDINSSSNL